MDAAVPIDESQTDGAPTEVLSDHALARISEVFGFDSLRPMQTEAIAATLAGRDALVVLPTGGGKSLCYQAPPLINGHLTLVISPLIALMADQLDALELCGYPAGALNSQMDAGAVRAVFAELDAGTLRLLLVSPERAMGVGFATRLRDGLERSGVELGAIAVDEAHCISHWGHDFRPEYRRIGELRDAFPGVAIQAYTATATPRVREDIAHQLGLTGHAELVGVFDRANLTYRIVPKTNVAQQACAAIERHRGEAAIVYCTTRRQTEELAEALGKQDIDAACYHAGLSPAKRRTIQRRFAREQLDVVVATVAFGMGIDRSDVRLVLHASLPRSIEAYQQETGRAGRDGLDAECVLLYAPGDVARWERLIRQSAEESGASDAIVDAQLELLTQMQRFATAPTCRHRALSEHFGQEYEREDCGGCDVCLGETELVVGGDEIARKVLACVARTGQRFGAGHIAEVLRGRANDRIAALGHDQLSTFGLMRSTSKRELTALIDQLVAAGALMRVGREYPVLHLTDAGIEIMRAEREVGPLAVVVARGRGAGPAKSRTEARPLSVDERDVFEALRALRRTLAQERGVPPYVVFSDATLRELVRARPTTLEAMLEVKGIGRAKLEAFGEVFLAELAEHGGSGEIPDDE